MKIIVYPKDQTEKEIKISIPTGLLCNRVSAGMALRKLVKQSSENKITLQGKDGGSIKISQKLAVKVVKEMNKFRKKHKDFVFIEAESASGDIVKITL